MRYPTTRELKAYGSTAPSKEEHQRLFEEVAALHELEQSVINSKDLGTLPLRIVSWNMERGRYGDRAAQLLESIGAEIILLTEMDIGMARSGQINTIQNLAGRLGYGHLFGTEFVELSLGDCAEQEACRGIDNLHGLHGNGIISSLPLQDAELVRLERSGKWFLAPWQGQLRIGGRMAVTAKLQVQEGELVLAAVHIESHSDPEDRRDQVRILLDAIDSRHGKDIPVLIGGDFNTNTVVNRVDYTDETKKELLLDDPMRFVKPEKYEPIFSLMEERGYRWQECNVEAEATQRVQKGSGDTPLHKLDWFFCRNMQVEEPRIHGAVDDFGELLSDHEILTITIKGLGPENA